MSFNLQNMTVIFVLLLYVIVQSGFTIVSASGDNVVINVIETKQHNTTNTKDDKTRSTATTNIIATSTMATNVMVTSTTLDQVKRSDAATTESIVSTTHPVHKDHRKPCTSHQYAQAACLNGGICFSITIGGVTSSHCNCPKLYTGTRCESIDPNYFLNGYIVCFCPNEWIRDGDSCYYFEQDKKTWDEASAACETAGGTLVVVDTQEEESFLVKEIQKFEGAFEHHRFWLDGSDNDKEGEWKWMSTGQLITGVHWFGGATGHSDDEDCLEIRIHDDGSVGWNDDQCDSHHYSICEIRDPRFPSTTTTTTEVPRVTTKVPITRTHAAVNESVKTTRNIPVIIG